MLDNSAFPLLCTELLRSGQSVRFRATGASMGPSIREGDVMTVAPVDPSEISRGEVILYTAERGLTAHRVSEFQKGASTFITRGDAPGSPSEQVDSRCVLGRVESVERNGFRLPFSGALGRHLARLTWFTYERLIRFRG